MHKSIKHGAGECTRPDIISLNNRPFLLFLLMNLCFILFPSPCESVTAGSVEIRGLRSVGDDELLNMMGIRAGGAINEEIVRDGIKRAFLKGLFEDITAKVPDGELPRVEVTVRERDFINKIYLSGNSALSKKVIKQLFLLKEDRMMRYDLIETAITQLKESIAKYGFVESNISVKIEKTQKPYKINIRLTVDTGVPIVVKDIKINIVPPYSLLVKEETILRVMKISLGGVFNQIKLEEDLGNIKQYFKKQGYYKPVVGPYSFKDGDLEVEVKPGRHMTVAIEGNSALSKKNLQKELPFFEIEDFSDEIVQEAVDKMLSLYHRSGYPFAQIAPVVHSDEKNKDVSFFIFEGERIKVGTITFSGASLSQQSLKDVLSLREGEVYNPDQIDADKESLKVFYGALGYLHASVKDIAVKVDKGRGTADIAVAIDEGKKTEIGSIEIMGVSSEIKSKLIPLLVIKAGSPYNEIDISDARFRLLEYFDDNGYPNVDIDIERSVQDYKSSIVFKVTEGKKIFFGKTVIIGNQDTRYEAIRRELLNKEGQPYNVRILSEDRQKLYKMGLFTNVEIETIEGEDDERDVLIKLTEGDAGAVEFGLGYGNFEKLRGFFEVSYRNLWGMNRVGLFRTEMSTLEKRFILQYNEPWFMGTSLPLRVFLLYQYKRELNFATKNTLFRSTRYGITAGFEKKLNNTLKAQLYYEFSLVNTKDVAPDVVLSREDTGTLAISAVKPAIVYDTRDNPFDPKNGILAGIQVKLATFLLFSETNFIKMEMYGSNFHKLSERITLALSARWGMAYGYSGTNELPIVERFFLGGRSTVRGYPQDNLGPKGANGDPTGGNAFLMSNVEFRTALGKGFGIVPFLDMGNVWVKANDVNPMQLKFTTGLGLRYGTPVGPLSVDYGIKLSRQPGESFGEVTFSIGQAF